MSRNIEFKTYLNEKEYEAVQKEMDKYGMSKSEYARFMILKKRIPKVLKTPPDLDRHTEAIENLSNQIAKLLSADIPYNYLYYSDFENIALELKRLSRLENELIIAVTKESR